MPETDQARTIEELAEESRRVLLKHWKDKKSTNDTNKEDFVKN